MDFPTDAPGPEQFELALFGPGVGESMALHLGGGAWIIIDSCLNPRSRQPVALDYLQSLGVDPEQAVTHLIATHWHDDHIRGLSTILHACPQARLVLSDAFSKREFREVVMSGCRSVTRSLTSGVDELRTCFEHCLERRDVPMFVSTREVLWERPTAAGIPVEVRCLSPTDGAKLRFYQSLGREMPGVTDLLSSRRVLPNQGPNETCVVILIRFGELQLLLGADLEGTARTGWIEIVESRRGSPKAQAYKVAHHGSPHSDHDKIWEELLEANPISMLTPFRKGSRPLPSASDISRIRSRSEAVYCSSPPQHMGTVTATTNFVLRQKKAATKTLVPVKSRMGLIRARLQLPGTTELNVTLHGAAVDLSQA